MFDIWLFRDHDNKAWLDFSSIDKGKELIGSHKEQCVAWRQRRLSQDKTTHLFEIVFERT